MKDKLTLGYQSILKSKIKYYGDTEAAREFAAEQYANAKALEVLEEVDKYCNGKINHISKPPMDSQGIHAVRDVKNYIDILRNRNKSRIWKI